MGRYWFTTARNRLRERGIKQSPGNRRTIFYLTAWNGVLAGWLIRPSIFLHEIAVRNRAAIDFDFPGIASVSFVESVSRLPFSITIHFSTTNHS